MAMRKYCNLKDIKGFHSDLMRLLQKSEGETAALIKGALDLDRAV